MRLRILVDVNENFSSFQKSDLLPAFDKLEEAINSLRLEDLRLLWDGDTVSRPHVTMAMVGKDVI